MFSRPPSPGDMGLRRTSILSCACLLIVVPLAASRSQAVTQLPLAPVKSSGQTVTPAFEGWYKNPDGSFSISFGYYNRNSEEALDIPIGPDNFIEPGDANQGQPTHFEPKRHWGVFAVKVPADFGEKKVVWTLKVRGETFAIPGQLASELADRRARRRGRARATRRRCSSSTRDGPGRQRAVRHHRRAAHGDGRHSRSRSTVWANDDGKAVGSDRERRARRRSPVTLTWFKHQGPGAVTFTPPTRACRATGGSATTTATFSEPGDYIVRVRANDASGVAGAGHAQCCWTNGFVKVTVTR